MVVDRSYFYLEFRVTVTANANFYLLYNWVGEGEPQLWVGVSTSDAARAPAVGGCQHLRCGPGRAGAGGERVRPWLTCCLFCSVPFVPVLVVASGMIAVSRSGAGRGHRQRPEGGFFFFLLPKWLIAQLIFSTR